MSSLFILFILFSFCLQADEQDNLANYMQYHSDLASLSTAIQQADIQKVAGLIPKTEQTLPIINTFLPRLVHSYAPVPGDNAVCLATRLYLKKGSKKNKLLKIIKYLCSVGSDPFFSNHKKETAHDMAKAMTDITLLILFDSKRKKRK